MATPPRPRPSSYQRAKRVVDRFLGRLGRSVSGPLPVEVHELAPVPADAVCPAPVNTAMVPAEFTRTYQEVFEEVTPNFRQLLYRLNNVNVAWHGTVVKNMRVFAPSLPQPQLELEFSGTFLLRQLKRRQVPELESGPVGLAFDSWSGNYFHWIAEVLPRLALLRKLQPDCLVLLPGPNPPEYIKQTVQALGFTHTYSIALGELVHVSDLWMPVRPGRHGYMVPSLVREVREAVMQHFESGLDPKKKATRRIYVSRNRQQWRHLVNEPAVLNVLERYGFETVYFEEMSFAEQVRTMYEAAIFIGIHGANMTNVLFMTPGTHAIEMLSETYINPSYLSMASSIGVHYSLVPSKLGSPPDVEHNYADITADPSLVEQVIRPLCQEA
ncbi:glycosyltransferase family 61 protein [Hymenobacter sediminicola]|uniref:Glycosyltransferase family 61 protein n=1 Tax=Hymenobacter sediminicola TaxID=2761579 RepID=A0A7G7W528_9BACT|nr:glycosyltransferase family 61 protein [Hymenobacter sediminicola]QNH61471.1 glycosyltransferase family 61 protein [Hymenobacter sediminicola]